MSPTVKVKVEVVAGTERQNQGHCPIAEALRRSDIDILSPKANRNTISFSRRSTGLRYTYATPRNAKAFLDKFDEPGYPEPFWLSLSDKDLIATRERRQRDP